jgi:lipopolysaccharide transport system ATP-binding protein
MQHIIRATGLGKQYTIGKRDAAYDTLRESLVQALHAPLRRLRGNNGKQTVDTIWALKDASFEIKPGEVVGIIGRNGAGKSTLLKVLSRITEPTTGRAELFGRVASLLEVGTGFHPELTGRENIYLNGAILGMKKNEIQRKFDQIVEFSELERFLDMPVKRYSSGMYMRLAFAVASHLEPEILVIDEVLAVGDAQFQKKCLGKMSDVATEGRTVLFVSHNMVAIQSLCKRAFWLEEGKIAEDGAAGTVVSNYLNHAYGKDARMEEVWTDRDSAPGNDSVRLHRILVKPRGEILSDHLTSKTPFSIEVEYWNLRPDARLHITLHLYTENEVIAFATGGGTTDREWASRPMPRGLFRSVCQIPADLLNAGRHRFNVFVIKDLSSVLYQYESEVKFEIVDLEEREISTYAREPGVVKPALVWQTKQIGEL